MKHKRLAVLTVLILFISIGAYIIYTNTYKEEFNYVAIGDSLAAGRNSYGAYDYGYTDYIRDYLKQKDKLSSYVNYAVSGYSTDDVINDINYNRTIEVDGKDVGLKRALRESDLVTISIGANDLLKNVNFSSVSSLLSDRNNTLKIIDETFEKIKEVLSLVRQYAKGDIIVVGYYNPVPNLTKYKKSIDDIVDYSNKQYQKICNIGETYYIEISDVMRENSDYLPNPLDIHPNIQGYQAISSEIIKIIDKEVLK